jgi:hypothetical protein
MTSQIKPFHIPFNRRRLLKNMAVAFAGRPLPGNLTGAIFVKFPSFLPPGANTGTP